MTLKLLQRLATRRVPHPHRPVLAPRHDAGAIGAVGHGDDGGGGRGGGRGRGRRREAGRELQVREREWGPRRVRWRAMRVRARKGREGREGEGEIKGFSLTHLSRFPPAFLSAGALWRRRGCSSYQSRSGLRRGCRSGGEGGVTKERERREKMMIGLRHGFSARREEWRGQRRERGGEALRRRGR